MAIIVDIIIIAIIIACVFFGYKKGLVGAAVNILGFIIALLIALILYAPISNFIINHTPIQPTLENAIKETVTPFVIKDNENNEEIDSEKTDNSPKVMTDYINGFIEKEKQKVEQTEIQIIDNVSKTVAANLIKIAVVIIVFIVAKVGLIFVKQLAKIISKLPIIGGFNKIGGAIYGVLQSLLIVYILFAVLSVFAPTMENSGILEAVNSSKIGSAMYNNNIILKIVF